MPETPRERYFRIEQKVTELIEKLPKTVIGQVARMLAQNIAHYQLQTGVDIPIEATMVLLNSPHTGPLDSDGVHALNAEALGELVSLLVWQGGEDDEPSSWQTVH